MAKKSARANPSPAAAPSPRGRNVPSVTTPTAEDLELAKDDALLQLRIGRSAHYYTVIVSALLLVDGFLVLFFQPNLSGFEPRAIRSTFFLIFPLFAGLYLAVFGLRVKWEVYQLWPWEPHFTTTVAALVLNLALVYLYFASTLGFGPTGRFPLLPWFYPLVLLGVAAPLTGLGLTWSEWSRRKAVSLAAALIPVPLAFVLYLPAQTAEATVNALAVTMFASAVLFQTAGSFLHLISSGTRTHEREVITSGQSRIFRLADELRQREEALRFREATLIAREADVENTDMTLRAQAQALQEARGHVSQLEQDLGARSEALAQQQRELALKGAEVNAAARAFEEREAALKLREEDLQVRLPGLAERDQRIAGEEAELRAREANLAQQQADLEHRLEGLPAAEARLEARRKELDRKTQELLQQEGELRSRATIAAAPGADPGLATRIADLQKRETQLQQLKAVLDEQNASLGRKNREVQDGAKQLESRQADLKSRTEELARREADVARREVDAKQRADAGSQRQRQYEETIRRYEGRLKDVETQTAEVRIRAEEVARLGESLKQRDQALKDREGELALQRQAFDRLQRELLERQKTLEAAEAEMSLRGQALTLQEGERRSGGFPIAFAAGTAPPGLGAETRRGRGARGAARAAPEEAEASGPVESLARDSSTLAPPPVVRHADRLPTGTPRLDDLLLGGFPPKSHVVLLGDPFVGKEILAYAFVAEGLKRGEPAILITANRSPEELAQKIGLVAPQFHEYEQLGRVSWIDASTPEGSAGAAPSQDHRTVVKGPNDHAGILSAIVAAAKRLEGNGGSPFRVAYFGLSASLAHGDERQAFNFLANVVGILKPRPALSVYSLESGALSDVQTETILSRMDGAIRCKSERDKTFLAVQGVGEVQTREWVEYRATNRALIIGSFTLGRIR